LGEVFLKAQRVKLEAGSSKLKSQSRNLSFRGYICSKADRLVISFYSCSSNAYPRNLPSQI